MLKSIFALAKMHFNQYSIYKSNFYLWTLNRVIEVMVYIFVWQAIYNQTGDAGGFTISQLVTYYILTATLRPFALWGLNEDIAYSIRTGKINKELLNPITYFQYYFGMNLGEMAFGLIIATLTFAVCSIFWVITLPANIMSFILFLIVLILGIPITFFIQMIVGTVGFYSSSIWGMEILKNAVICIFSGIIAPITLFPMWFQKIANILPFKDLIYTPINIWLGQVPTNEIIFVILKQLIWTIILYVIAKIFFNYSIKKITINGG
jgi:ABC-2 type transport system permease protein